MKRARETAEEKNLARFVIGSTVAMDSMDEKSRGARLVVSANYIVVKQRVGGEVRCAGSKSDSNSCSRCAPIYGMLN